MPVCLLVFVSFYLCSCFLSTTCRNGQLCMCLLVIALFYTLLFRDFTKMQCGVLSIRKVFVCLIRLTQAKSHSPSKDFCFLNERRTASTDGFRHPHLILQPLLQNYSLNRQVSAFQFLVELSRHYKGLAGHHCSELINGPVEPTSKARPVGGK